MDLCNRSTVRELLNRYSLAPKKGFGQNFLVNPAIPQMIAECSYEKACQKGDGAHAVLEIGPGIGALTVRLASLFDRVVAVEIDHGLIPLLGETLSEFDNIEIVEADVMSLSICDFIEEKFGDILAAGGTLSVCANLPYYITSPVIMKLLEAYPTSEPLPYAALTFMIQLEVAERLASEPGASEYGSVTASVGMRAYVQREFTVSAGNFHPAPKVSSAVVSLIPHGGIREIYPESLDSPFEGEQIAKSTLSIISAAFSKRRKTLVNALSELYPKSLIAEALEDLDIRTDIRGECLSVREFCMLADRLLQGHKGDESVE